MAMRSFQASPEVEEKKVMTGAPRTAKMSLEQQLHESIVAKLREWVAVMPDPNQPIIGIAGSEEGGGVLTPKIILENVETRNPKGEEFVSHWVELMVDHIAKSQL